MAAGGPQFQQLKPGQQFQIDLKNATPKVCECGSEFFTPAVKLFTVSALVSPTGIDMVAQQPVLVCMGCKKVA
jgi:hypothetical protein